MTRLKKYPYPKSLKASEDAGRDLEQTKSEEKRRDESYYDTPLGGDKPFGETGAPQPGEKGYKPEPTYPTGAYDGANPGQLADSLFTNTLAYMEDPEFGSWWAQHTSDYADYIDPEDIEDDPFAYSTDDLATMMGVPISDEEGTSLHTDERWSMAQGVMALVMETRPEGWGGQEYGFSSVQPRAEADGEKGPHAITSGVVHVCAGGA